MCVMTLLRNQHPHSSSSLATFITSSAHTTHTVDLDDLGRDHILGKRTSKLLEVAPSRSFVLGHIHLTSFTNCFNWFTKAQVYTANNKQGYSFFVVSIIRHVKAIELFKISCPGQQGGDLLVPASQPPMGEQ